MGEAKKFKGYEQRVARINGFEAELEHHSDEELREGADELRERARDGESLDDLLSTSASRWCVRPASDRWACATSTCR